MKAIWLVAVIGLLGGNGCGLAPEPMEVEVVGEALSVSKTLQIAWQGQETGYWCGPASTRIALSARLSPPPTQSTLASYMGTTTNGTDHIGLVRDALNHYLNTNVYATANINDPPTQTQRDLLKQDLVNSISANYALVGNVVSGWRPPGYPSGTIYHYVAIVGYDRSGESALIADPAGAAAAGSRWSNVPRTYSVALSDLATWIGGKGYTAARVPPPVEPDYMGSSLGVSGQSYPVASQGAVQVHQGETVTGWVKLKNTGTRTWTRQSVWLAPIPRDQASPFRAPSWLNDHRISTPDQDVAPGAVGEFKLDITGRDLGKSSLKLGWVAEGATWFADQPKGGGPPDGHFEVVVDVVEPLPRQDGGQAAAGASGTGVGSSTVAGAAGAAGAAGTVGIAEMPGAGGSSGTAGRSASVGGLGSGGTSAAGGSPGKAAPPEKSRSNAGSSGQAGQGGLGTSQAPAAAGTSSDAGVDSQQTDGEEVVVSCSVSTRTRSTSTTGVCVLVAVAFASRRRRQRARPSQRSEFA